MQLKTKKKQLKIKGTFSTDFLVVQVKSSAKLFGLETDEIRIVIELFVFE